MSDLHLETQDFPWRLPTGEILIIAGDLCHAAYLDPQHREPHAVAHRDRVQRFVASATASFEHVLLIAGNHDHYHGVIEDTVTALRRHLPGVTVLDDEAVDIAGVRFFGTTLWSDFAGHSDADLSRLKRGIGEYFFVKTRTSDRAGPDGLAKLVPQDTLRRHVSALDAMKRVVLSADARPTVVISHHAPSRKGLNPLHAGNGLDGAYASDLDALIASFSNVPVWVHGHTHIKRTYRIGAVTLRANCRGFDTRGATARAFTVDAYFDV